MSSNTDVKMALLIDFENISISLRKEYNVVFDADLVIQELSEIGVITIRRAYGDWHQNQAYRRQLLEHGIELIEKTFLNESGKNGADIKLTIDALEIAIKNANINAFAIISGDSDFLPLIQKLREYGKYVIVLSAENSTSSLIIKNCDRFISYDTLANLRKDEKEILYAVQLLDKTLQVIEEKGERSNISSLKIRMQQVDPSFDEKNYNFNKFLDFIRYICDQKLMNIELEQNKTSWSIIRKENNAIDEEGLTSSQNVEIWEDRPLNGNEWIASLEAVEQCLIDGQGLPTEGRLAYIYAYLERRRTNGLLPVSDNKFREIIQRFVAEGLIRAIGRDKYQLVSDFSSRKKKFIASMKT